MPSSVSTRTSSTSMLVTARSRSRGVAPAMTIGSVTTRVSTRVIFIVRVCYTAVAMAGRGTRPPPLSSVKGLGLSWGVPATPSPPLHGLVVTVGLRVTVRVVMAVLGRLVSVAVGFARARERPIHGRRTAGQPMEHHRKVAARAETDRVRDGVDRQLALLEQLARTFDAPPHDEAVRRQPRALLEEPREVILAHVRLGAEPRERQRAGKVVVDEFRPTPKSRPWQPVHRVVLSVTVLPTARRRSSRLRVPRRARWWRSCA